MYQNSLKLLFIPCFCAQSGNWVQLLYQRVNAASVKCRKLGVVLSKQKRMKCSLFKEWILEKSEIRVNLEWTFVLFTHFGVTTGITAGTPKWVNNTNVHSKFTLIALFSKIHSLKSEHIHSFLFREYMCHLWHVWQVYMMITLHNLLCPCFSNLVYWVHVYILKTRGGILMGSGNFHVDLCRADTSARVIFQWKSGNLPLFLLFVLFFCHGLCGEKTPRNSKELKAPW